MKTVEVTITRRQTAKLLINVPNEWNMSATLEGIFAAPLTDLQNDVWTDHPTVYGVAVIRDYGVFAPVPDYTLRGEAT